MTYIARDAVATIVFRAGLGSRAGFACSNPRAALSADLRTMTVTPFACELGRTPVRRFDTGLAVVSIRGFHPERVEVGEATLDYRPRDLSNVRMNTLGELAEAVGMATNFVKSMLDGCDMYSISGPQVFIRKLVSKRGGEIESRIYGFHKSSRELWSRTQIDRLRPAGQPSVTVTNLDMEVTPNTGHMRATVQVGPMPAITVHLRGDDLAGPSPRMHMSL